MRLRSEVKGTSATRGHRASSSSLEMPTWAAAITRAVSVGSPMALLPSAPAGSKTASVHNDIAFNNSTVLRDGGSTAGFSSAFTSRVGTSCSVSTGRCLPATSKIVTVIRFCVSVPVLSEQITVTDPNVSTAVSLRTSALRCNIRCEPSASATVTTAANPSGIAATAILMPVSSSTSKSSPRSSPSTTTSTIIASATTASTRPRRSRRRCSGVGARSTF